MEQVKHIVCKNCSASYPIPADKEFCWCKHCGVLLKVTDKKVDE